MPRLEEACRALEDYETYLRSKLNVPEGEEWYGFLPENSTGDRLFKRWQALGVAVRRADERGQ